MVGDAAVQVVWARPVPASLATALLDDRERARLASLRVDAEADRYASAHTLLRLVLAEELGRHPRELQLSATCRTCGGPHGRPEVVGRPGLHLSLTHAGDRVAVALTRTGPVGIDVELVSATQFDGFADVALAPGEQADTPAARARTWVRKEALLKATGHGLAVDPRSVVLTPPGSPPALLSWTAQDPPGPLRMVDVDVGPGHAACVVVLGPQRWSLHVREGDLASWVQ